tara:strand:+ start:498 stop:2942 length:2445 start_codon:yes stop_codon:yes gene_type:complete
MKGKIVMGHEIKRIDSIKSMAVFRDFQWASAVRDGGNNIAEFKNINIFYGRNYSGKTTLSRIFRALETGSISDKYSAPEFQLSFNDSSNATQNSLNSHGQVVRVFNEDFVRDNLRFIIDNEQPINSFAILGEDNAKIEEEIERHESELGNEEDKSGLLGELLSAKDKFEEAQTAHKNKLSELDGKLSGKANREGTGIKHNKLFGDVLYNVPKLRADINTVMEDTYSPLTGEEVSDFSTLLKEESKPVISESLPFNLKYSTITSTARELIEKRVQASDPIKELLSDALLEGWVRAGRQHHLDKRDKCAFCGSELPSNLWGKLNKHFNQESEDLRQALDNLLTSIEDELLRVANLLKIKNLDFYSIFTTKLDLLAEQLSAQLASYCESLNSIKEQVEKRKGDIFTPLIFDEPKSFEGALNAARHSFEELRNESNQFTASLGAEQLRARAALRLHEVHTFINDINYEDENIAIAILKEKNIKAEEAKNTLEKNIKTKRSRINVLKSQLKDERMGADRVNDYLNNFFGHQFLSLNAIEENPGEASSGYRFEVTRNDKKAFHLSEGECSLIAFCYFMAKLEDIETKGNQPIIWIDDPISSLDANHIFFVYSLINAKIVKQKNYLQLFISTHNLDFLKYLKRISNDYKGKGKKKIREFFLVERSGDSSQICLMPEYLKNYVTEFNYLFHQIYKCATAESINDENYHEFYNFGNNARKFLEIYLYYKYPNGVDGDDKLLRFFGADNIPVIFTNRVNNEYSHLCGGFERGASPIEVPEMKTVAQHIISKIKNDPEQYLSLLQSIGEKDDVFEKSLYNKQEAQ